MHLKVRCGRARARPRRRPARTAPRRTRSMTPPSLQATTILRAVYLLALEVTARGAIVEMAMPMALENHSADPYFPIYHIRPMDGWHTNDPNGPFAFNGVFHLFSQCRQMAVGMPIPPGGWCHYASRNLVYWRRLGYPLKPDQSYDNISLDTGSATIVDGVPTMLIPGVGHVTDGSVNFTCPSFRSAALRGPCRVRMSFAVPVNLSDPWLRVWQKPVAENPLIDTPPADIEPYWHDFSQAWQDERSGRWWAFAGAGWRGRKAAPCPTCRDGAPVPLCSVPNGSFHKAGAWECKPGDELWVATNGTAGEPTEVFAHSTWSSAAFSCPELYPLPSPMPTDMRIFEGLLDDGQDHYWSGKYNNATRRFDPTGYTALQYNWGAANAGKSFWHADSGRRLLWQWLHVGKGGSGGCDFDTAESDFGPAGHGVVLCPTAKHAWDGVMSVPQEVRWDPHADRLIITPVAEIDQLRNETFLSTAVSLKAAMSEAVLRAVTSVSMAHVDIVLRFNVSRSRVGTRGTSVGLKLFMTTGPPDNEEQATVQVELNLSSRIMTVRSPEKNATAPLPSPILLRNAAIAAAATSGHRHDAEVPVEVVELRVLVDGEQFEVFGLGGRANVALHARPDYNSTNILGKVFAIGLVDDDIVDISAKVYNMQTAYEDDKDEP